VSCGGQPGCDVLVEGAIELSPGGGERRAAVADDLRNDIQAGRLPSGARLPSEADLVHQYGVSRVTIRHAIKALSDEGLAEAVHGRGTFITHHSRPTSAL